MHGTRTVSVGEIDQCLPQTQCTMCGFPKCLDYAEALFRDETDINRCSPGGVSTIHALAEILDKTIKPLAEDCESFPGRQVARIQEENCIGCTLCIAPCPVDAIIGASKFMHSVLTEECTGCRLCVEYCPVDCIELIDWSGEIYGSFWQEFRDDEVSRWRDLTERRQQRYICNSEKPDFIPESEDMRMQIRSAVNRERSKRWKKSRRSAGKSKSLGPAI